MISQGAVQPNIFADPGSTQAVVFEAPSRLARYQSQEIWIGAMGSADDWGGCNVFVSADGVTYKQVGSIDQAARLGVLDSTFASGTDPDLTNSLVVDLAENSAPLESGSSADADQLNLLCYVDGELISYSACSSTGQDQCTMGTYIRRGVLGSSVASHAAGSSFLRLDDAVFQFDYDPSWAGRPIYFKFQSFNSFGNATQDLSAVTAVPFTIPGQAANLPPAQTTAIVNADFEIGTDVPPYGWKLDSGITIIGITYVGIHHLPKFIYGGIPSASLTYDSATPYAGSRSLQGEANVSGAASAVVSCQKYLVRAGDGYQISAALNLVSGGSGSAVQAVLAFLDANGNSVSSGASDIVASKTSIGGGWSVVKASGTVPAGAVSAVIRLQLQGNGNDTVGEWDSVQLTASRSGSISYVIDGGGSVLTTGVKGQVSVPANCTITGWVITSDVSGSAVVDVLRGTYAAFPTVSSIAGTAKPTLSSAQKNQNTTLSGWGSTALSASSRLWNNPGAGTGTSRQP